MYIKKKKFIKISPAIHYCVEVYISIFYVYIYLFILSLLSLTNSSILNMCTLIGLYDIVACNMVMYNTILFQIVFEISEHSVWAISQNLITKYSIVTIKSFDEGMYIKYTKLNTILISYHSLNLNDIFVTKFKLDGVVEITYQNTNYFKVDYIVVLDSRHCI